jgi:asparagine synthetase A
VLPARHRPHAVTLEFANVRHLFSAMQHVAIDEDYVSMSAAIDGVDYEYVLTFEFADMEGLRCAKQRIWDAGLRPTRMVPR